MITNLLFDLDGTLIDPKIGITESIRYGMQEMQRPLPPETNLDWCIGPPLQENFAKLLNTTDEQEIDTAVAHFRVRFSQTGLFEATVYDGIEETLASLKEQYEHLFLATSKPHQYARQILDHFDLTSYFAGVYGSEMDGRLANKAELIKYVLQQEQLSPAQTIMIGDREHDIIGAKANQVWAGGASYGYGREAELTAAKADILFTTPAEIPSLLTKFFPRRVS